MKRLVISVVALMMTGIFSAADAQMFNPVIKRDDIYNRKPIPLPKVREADVFWMKTVWRIIDLREKINQPMYFPTEEIGGRTNLINVLLKGIEDGVVTAYDARSDDEFRMPITFSEVKDRFGAKTVTKRVQNFETGEWQNKTIAGQIRTEEVKQVMLKEVWYFDKHTSTMQVRILGMCPIRIYLPEDATAASAVERSKVFWVSYPEARQVLARNPVFNPHNDAATISFDDMFIKRMFTGYIVAESNTFNNRLISQYLSAEEAMMESKRVEEKMFNFEQDLWEY
ncbi:gliding motility protein GldN [Prolixibacteraceae bacterium JC049]|nr:gliding motility protein GldN [Prolixibacteraceae bacterium JC049]